MEPVLRCPKCGSSDIRRTMRDGMKAWLLRKFGRAPFLCRSCHNRFYRSRTSRLAQP